MNAAVFHQAVADGDATRVKFLINIGQQARVNQRNKHGYTSLQQSCKDGRLDVVNVLLNHGANTNATGRKGRTALHLASAGGYADIVELLISSCADFNVKDNEGNLPIDVAKTEEVAELLSKADAEKRAKSAEATKKNNSEDWSQNVKSLPAGSRNSLVSNSSSDSGVFTEDSSCARYVDSRTSCFSSRSGNRAIVGDARTMGVLNEGEELHERSRFFAQTTVKPQPKLRRSMSDRFASRHRRVPIGRRDISEELSALNLCRTISRQEPEILRDYYYNQGTDSSYYEGKHASVESPIEDLGYGAEIQDDDIEVESRRSSLRKYFENTSRSLARNRGGSLVCYAGGEPIDEGWEEDEEAGEDETVLASTEQVIQGRPYDDDRSGFRKGWDEVELYRRSVPRNRRSARRQTVNVCESSHERDTYLAAADTVDGYSTNELQRGAPRFRRPRSASRRMETIACEVEACVDARTIACEVDSCLDRRGVTLTRNTSACSDTATGLYYQRLQTRNTMLYENHVDFNHNDDYYVPQDYYRNPCSKLPDYEEALRRFSSESVRRPASRQISQV